jgi:hypothetical protein
MKSGIKDVKILICTTKTDKIFIKKMAKERGLKVSQYFRELVRRDKELESYKPYFQKIQRQNMELIEKLNAIEKCYRVQN